MRKSDHRSVRQMRRLPLLLPAAAMCVLVVMLAAAAGRMLVVTREVGSPDAILALGSHEWERLPAVAALAGRHPEAVVLLTQPRVPTPHNCHLCADRVPWLERLGVARARIEVLPQTVTNTWDEAQATAAFSRERPVGTLLVVTSVYHTRRALATFDAAFRGLPVRIGMHAAASQSPAEPERWWHDPYDRAYVRYEWAALAWYAVRHRVNPFAAGPPDAAAVERGAAAAETSAEAGNR